MALKVYKATILVDHKNYRAIRFAISVGARMPRNEEVLLSSNEEVIKIEEMNDVEFVDLRGKDGRNN